MDTKTCRQCGREFEKPRNVSRAMWAERQFCSHACWAKSRERPPIRCEGCGRFFQPKNRSLAYRPRFCSHACHGRASRKLDTRTCEHCGKDYGYNGRAGVWKTRKYCSTACAYADRRGRKTGAEHWAWKGGRTIDPSGYVHVLLPDDHPFAGMRHNGRYILEHRLVMAEHLGRPLHRDETVHHKNGHRADNRFENLELRAGRHGKGSTEPHCRTCTCFA